MVMESFEYRHHLNPEHFCHSKKKSHPISKQSLPASPFPWRPLSHFLFLFSCLLGTFPVLVIFLISFCVLVLMGDERNQPLWPFVDRLFSFSIIYFKIYYVLCDYTLLSAKDILLVLIWVQGGGEWFCFVLFDNVLP